ncbi:unnamed protein product [Urochloa decumbens]|uniref:GDSL esterase/lipase n=1 Tax=Urochloa decumbens TaxID=240449 RepID=A0ABC8ZSM1_9POAL
MQIMRSSLCAAAVVLVLLSPWKAPVQLASAAAPSPDAQPHYASIFCLGDSFIDTGNNPAVFGWYKITDPVTRLPYGSTFFNRPTGRNCDGRLIVDFIAEGLKLPFVPPYLGPPFGSPSQTSNGTFRHGASFAVGGATALDAEFYHSRGIPPGPTKFPLNTSLSVQLEWLESHLKPSLCNTTKECEELFGRSLFFVGEFGVNDYQFAIGGKMKDADIRSDVVAPIQEAIRQAIERLIKLGVKTLVVPGVIPLGCSPMILSIFPEPDPTRYDSSGCIERHNELARHHNTMLQKSLDEIRGKHPGVKIIYADFFGTILEMIESPPKFGFRKDILQVCCGGPGKHNYNMTVPCGDKKATTCSHPSASVYWDGIHFTEAANRHVASSWLSSISSVGK